MLRVEKMSRVSVTGSKAVMDDVIEAIHDLNLVHLSDYDGSWDGFEEGDPIQGADGTSDKLVTVRSLESILDVTPEDAGPSFIITGDAIDEELEPIRQDVNRLDDRRETLQEELNDVTEKLELVRPYTDLGIDLDLLSGYDSIVVRVGRGDAGTVESALADAPSIEESEVFTGTESDILAVFASVAPDAPSALDEVLVDVTFTSLDVPDAEGSPESCLEELEHDEQTIRSKINSVESELEEMRLEAASFLLAAEETLAIDVQKQEAPLQFATTEHSFVAEGWIPTQRYRDLETAVETTVGDRADVDELERASYHDPDDHHVAADGGTAEKPPVVQDNPDPAKPFELLVETINKPRYFEFDPTIVLFLTLPIFFGFMIGDVGYGLLYLGLGWYLYTRYEGGFKSLGGIALWSGAVTVVFGIIFGEVFGFHYLGEILWNGHPPLEKGLTPATVEWALLWLFMSVIAGLIHVNLGYIFDFRKKLDHSFKHAFLEAGSWILLMNGVWLWILSTNAKGDKPEFIFTALNGQPLPLGFAGFSPAVGTAGLVLAVLGLLTLIVDEGVAVAILESLNVLTNVLSYARLTAEIVAEAGIALVVNLLVFGASFDGESYHFLISEAPSAVTHGEVVFGGLFHMGIVGVLAGIVILVLGHMVVLALGVVSAGLQALRLEYVEFFGKFYEGGGEKYQPFGYDRSYTTED